MAYLHGGALNFGSESIDGDAWKAIWNYRSLSVRDFSPKGVSISEKKRGSPTMKIRQILVSFPDKIQMDTFFDKNFGKK